MGLRLDISTNKLVEGQIFQLETLDSTATTIGVYDIEIIGEWDIATSLQANSTENYIPSQDVPKISVDNLAITLSQIPNVFSVTKNATVITLIFGSVVSDVVFVDSTNIKVIKKTLADGTVTSYGSAFLTNMIVTSVMHNSLEFNRSPTKIVNGNATDLIETIIRFKTSHENFYLELYLNWVDNNTDIYTQPNSFKIDPNLFIDNITGSKNRFLGNSDSSINNVYAQGIIPRQGNLVSFLDITGQGDEGEGVFEFDLIIHHHIPLFPRQEDANVDGTLNTPSFVNSSIKPIFEINLRKNNFDTDIIDTTSLQNLSQYFGAGNVGYFEEVLKTGQTFYKLNSFTFDNEANEINNLLPTKGTIVIQNINTNEFLGSDTFTEDYDIIFKLCKIDANFNQTKTFLENIEYDSIQTKMNGIEIDVFGYKVKPTIEGNENIVEIYFEIPPNDLQNYALWVTISRGDNAFTNQNVLCRIGKAVSIVDDSVVQFPDEYNYNYHYDLDIANAFNDVKSFVGDYVLSRFQVKISELETTFNSILLRIIGDNAILESFQINANQLNFELDRQFLLPTTDIRRKVIVEKTVIGTDQFFDITYPFLVRENWGKMTNVYQETVINCTQNEIVFTKSWKSLNFNIGFYNQTKNSFADPQIVSPPSFIKYFDESLNEVGKILNTGKTIVIAVFIENNLGDLMSEPNPIPNPYFIYPPMSAEPGYLTGYFGLEVNGKYFQFSHAQPNEPSMFEPYLGVDYFPMVNRENINAVQMLCKIDAQKLRKELGINLESCIKISARIDKIPNAEISDGAFSDGFSNGFFI
jgi:hypothetical protein